MYLILLLKKCTINKADAYPAVANKAKNSERNEAIKVPLFRTARLPKPAKRKESEKFIQKTE